MTFRVELKSQISERELDEAVDVCVRAYVGELASNSMVGGDEELKTQIWRAMIRAGLLAGEVYFALDSSHKVLGVAVWFPPGKSLFDSEEQRTLGFDHFMQNLSPETQRFWAESYVPLVDKFLAEVLGPNGVRDSQYLNQLATDPSFQKKGIATTLLKTFGERDVRPLFAHCASNEKNARFYESCGYTIRGKMYMEAPTGGYPVIVLTK
ncbi:hypothetical protein C8R45DRAFT_1114959 [Mycena sanguinolenta]|nr:hypothetical protein C8R45DRAFT_1114959 [Mycena sanguinolenta]